jgi:hypothetical protein
MDELQGKKIFVRSNRHMRIRPPRPYAEFAAMGVNENLIWMMLERFGVDDELDNFHSSDAESLERESVWE